MNENQVDLFAKDLHQLQKKDFIQAEKIFQSLPFEQQVALIQRCAPEISRDIIFLSRDAQPILKAISNPIFSRMALQEHLEDSSTLLSNCTPEQFSYSMDLDIWRQGSIDHTRFLEWVEVIKEIPTQQFKILSANLDINLLATCLKKYVEVNIEPSQLLLAQHLDTPHHFTLNDLNIENAEVEAFVGFIAYSNLTLFNEIIKTITFHDSEEVLNEARGTRDDKLAKDRMPSYEEAMVIYTALSNFDFIYLNHQYPPEQETNHTPITPHKATESFLELTLKHLNQANALTQKEKLDIMKRLAVLANHALVADGVSLSDDAKYRETIKKANTLYNIGLEYLAESLPDKALHPLKSMTAIEIFQAGYTLLMHLRNRASAILNDEDEILIRYSKATTTLLRFMDLEIPLLYHEVEKKAFLPSSLSEVMQMHRLLCEAEDQRKSFS